MKVTLINHSDIRGGASMASLRLLEALQAQGIEARMIVNHMDGPARPDIDRLGGRVRKKTRFIAERAEIFLHNGFNRRDLFKVSTASYGMDLSRHPWIADADILAVNWINQGMLSLDDIEKLGRTKPLVWTMHDMWPMTGICHLAPDGCDRYTHSCGDCPYLGRWASGNDISRATYLRKLSAYSRFEPHFVAVSNWLAQCAHKSSLLRDKSISVIPNAFDVKSYPFEPLLSRNKLGLPDDSIRLVTICAARLDDDIKNLPAAIEAINIASTNTNTPFALVLVGEIRHPEILDNLNVPFAALGPVSHPGRMADIYAHSAVVLSSSNFETLGYTLIEGMSAGATPVAFGGDGRQDIIEHGVDGYLATPGSTNDLAKGILWAIGCNRPRAAQHEAAAAKFDSESVALQYITLFNSILHQSI